MKNLLVYSFFLVEYFGYLVEGGCNPLCGTGVYTRAGTCQPSGRCMCFWGWTGPNAQYTTNNQILADYCRVSCLYTHNHKNPECVNSNRTGGECKVPSSTTPTKPCDPKCGNPPYHGRGQCLTDGRCLCWWGWTGPNACYVEDGMYKNRLIADYCAAACHYTPHVRNPKCLNGSWDGEEGTKTTPKTPTEFPTTKVPTGQKWDNLQVTFMKFNNLPETSKDAEEDGWKKTASCSASSYFRGNRYVLNGDKTTMVLYDCKGNFAGIQFGIAKSLAIHPSFNKSSWIQEEDFLVVTAYFVHPSVICNNKRLRYQSPFTEDNLYIQIGSSPKNLMSIPYMESNIGPTPWVKGRCFYAMGQHYWYNVSKEMSCKDSFPVFLLYHKGELTGFGWAMIADLKTTSRVEHPEPNEFGYFFDKKTQPKCLDTVGVLTTQHIYLKKYPLAILCPLFG